MGLAIPLGLSVADAWARSLRGASAIGPARLLQAAPGRQLASAEVEPLDLSGVLKKPKDEKFMGRSVRLALWAAKSALAASAQEETLDPERFALYTASGQTGLEAAEFFGAFDLAASDDEATEFANLGGRASRMLDRYWSLRTLANAGVGLLSAEIGTRGASDNIVQGDTAAAVAVNAARHELLERRCDAALVVAYDSLLGASTYLAYEKAGLLSRGAPAEAYRPFDRNRDGLVLGEGAAALVLEREETARGRGAAILGEVLGVGLAMDPGDDDRSAREARRAAIEEAMGTLPVQFVVAHGIGTVEGDRNEARALRALLAAETPVTALKSQTGYLGAATGAVEIVLALQAGEAGFVPPIARHESADEGDGPRLVSGTAAALAAERPIGLVLAQSWFGQYAAVAVRAARASGAASAVSPRLRAMEGEGRP
jgi:3-oxoacyl-[acyl-carrier-protein] synthase II